MPVIAVNIAGKTFSEIQELVGKGHYVSPEQFLEIAAFNQLALERGTKPDKIVADGHRNQGRAKGAKVPDAAAVLVQDEIPVLMKKRSGDADGAMQPALKPDTAPKARSRRAAPAAVRKSGKAEGAPVDGAELLKQLSLERIAGAAPVAAETRPRPDGERLWGQVNRLFALKVAARWLVISAAQGGDWSKLDVVSDPMADAAAGLGTYLDQVDERLGHKRDDVLATGLPRRGNAASKDRFISQFVARTTRNGDIYPGGICQYALATFDGDRLLLTGAGVELANARNPVLDDAKTDPPTLSDAERGLVIRTVVAFVPGERHDFEVVVRLIREGRATPDELMSAIRGQLPEAWSDVMARTHVSGVIARMADLGIIHRKWDGRNVKYVVGDQAAALQG